MDGPRGNGQPRANFDYLDSKNGSANPRKEEKKKENVKTWHLSLSQSTDCYSPGVRNCSANNDFVTETEECEVFWK